MTIFDSGPKVMTADFNAGDIGYVKKGLGHYLQNVGNTDLIMVEVFKADHFAEVALSDWLTHTPPDMVMQTLNISAETLAQFPRDSLDIVPE